jgi:hypothetical protein
MAWRQIGNINDPEFTHLRPAAIAAGALSPEGAAPKQPPKMRKIGHISEPRFAALRAKLGIETYPMDARGNFHAEDPQKRPYQPITVPEGGRARAVGDRWAALNADEEADYLANEQAENMRRSLPQSSVPALRAVQGQVAASLIDTAGTLGRVVPNPDDALLGVTGDSDELHRLASLLRSNSTTQSERALFPTTTRVGSQAVGTLSKTVPLALATGPVGPILESTLTRGSQAVQEGRDAGLEGADLARYVGKAASIEGVTTAAFQGLNKFLPGIGGLENIGSKTAKETAGQVLKRLGLSVAGELAEEEAITVLDALNQTADGVDPKAWANVDKAMKETALVTLATMGLANTPRAANLGLDAWARRNPDKAKAVAAIQDPTRGALEAAGLEGVSGVDDKGRPLTTKEERAKFVADVKAAIADPNYKPGPAVVQPEFEADPNELQHYPPNVLGVDESGAPVFGERGIKDAPTTPKKRSEPTSDKPFRLPNAVTRFADVGPGDMVAYDGRPWTVKARSESGNKFDLVDENGNAVEDIDRRQLNGYAKVPRRGEPLPDSQPQGFVSPPSASIETPAAAPASKPTESPNAAQSAAVKPLVDRETLQREMPGTKITDLDDGSGWQVQLEQGQGRWFTVRNVAKIAAPNREAAERTMGRKLSDEEFSRFEAAASWQVSTADGYETTGEGLLQLVNGKADSKKVRHELLHAARGLGLLTEAEWRALVGRYAPQSKGDKRTAEAIVQRKLTDAEFAHMQTDGYAEEQIALGYEKWKGPNGLWQKLVTALNRFLSRFGIVNPTADTALARLQDGSVWNRTAKPETKREAAQRLAGDVRYSGDLGPEISIKPFAGGQTHKTLRDRAMAWFKANLAGKQFVNRATGKKIAVSRPAINKAASHMPDAKPLAAIEVLPQLLESAEYRNSEAYRGDDKNTRGFHYFTAPLTVDGAPHTTTLKIREDANGHFFYDQHIVEQSAQKNSSPLGRPRNPEGKPNPSGEPKGSIGTPPPKVKPDPDDSANENGTSYSGRVANYGEQDDARKAVDQLDAQAAERKFREEDDIVSEGESLLPTIDKTILSRGHATNPVPLTPAETYAAKKYLNGLLEQANRTNDAKSLAEAAIYHDAYRRTGTAASQAFAGRRDPLRENPTQKNKRTILEAMFDLPQKLQKKVDAMRKAGNHAAADEASRRSYCARRQRAC